jgi:DNA polymerase
MRHPTPSPLARLHALAADAATCERCPLWQHATQTVWGEGPPRARLMLVGEQPGDKEDLAGRPFVGPAGQLLDRALDALGWPRDELYVTNAVKHFKFELRGKRRMHKTPAQREIEACQLWLDGELELVRPKAAVALGATATRSLLGKAVPVLANRGQWLARDDGLPVLVTLHPSALLRLRGEDRDAAFERWLEDLRVAEPHLA